MRAPWAAGGQQREPVVLQGRGGAGSFAPPPRFRAPRSPLPLAPCLALPCLPPPPLRGEEGVRSPPRDRGVCALRSPPPAGLSWLPEAGVQEELRARSHHRAHGRRQVVPESDLIQRIPAARGCRELNSEKTGNSSLAWELWERGPRSHFPFLRNMCSGGVNEFRRRA